jgi:phosphoribosylaminoimidazolecarboxamide formyltransferase/IMP cyclohydrolase
MPIALFSVSNKTGIRMFAESLHQLGWDLLASGGTARAIREAGVPVTDVADFTGSPEILGGRVKTLHPAVSGGILARDTAEDVADLEKINTQYIDLVACNLYPFQQTISKSDFSLAEAIENIDIGGVTLIRAAAKNFKRVTVLTDPSDYALVVEELKSSGSVSEVTRRKLANKGFTHTAEYDAAISGYMNDETST